MSLLSSRLVLPLHLSKIVLSRTLAVAVALGGLAVALDLVESAAVVLEREDGGILRYLALRAPLIMTVVAPVALIIGPVLAFLSLSTRSEFTILRAAGATTYRLLLMLAPLAILIGAGLFVLNDRVAPMLEGRLITWLDDEPELESGSFWARTTTSVVRAEASSRAGDRLFNLNVYEIDAEGRLTARVNADAAWFDGEVWRFERGARLEPGRGASVSVDGRVWETPIKPANVRALATPATKVGGETAGRMLTGAWAGNRTSDYYLVRVFRGYSAALTPALMFLLAAPAAFGTRRGGGIGKRAALAVGLGFGFLVLDGMLAALGETGNLPPALAAFGATAMFAAIGAYALITLEE
ncbi:MAG: LptF/LptG family permease [Pseudomonadota bacterium]